VFLPYSLTLFGAFPKSHMERTCSSRSAAVIRCSLSPDLGHSSSVKAIISRVFECKLTILSLHKILPEMGHVKSKLSLFLRQLGPVAYLGKDSLLAPCLNLTRVNFICYSGVELPDELSYGHCLPDPASLKGSFLCCIRNLTRVNFICYSGVELPDKLSHGHCLPGLAGLKGSYFFGLLDGFRA
jgi:hypothetical protein